MLKNNHIDPHIAVTKYDNDIKQIPFFTISVFFSNWVFEIVKIFSWVYRRIKLTYIHLMYTI